MMYRPVEQPRQDQASSIQADHDHLEQSGEGSAESLLARAFVQEIHTAAILTAGCASAVNFAAATGRARTLTEAGSLISGYGASVDQWPRRILSEHLSRNAVEQAGDFFAAFQRAAMALRDYETESNEIGSERAAHLHAAKLTTDWRQTARAGRDVIETLDREAELLLPQDALQSGRLLMSTLDRIIAGNPECCALDGTIVLPQLAERRRAPRHTLLQDARIHVANRSFDAFARDISSGGLGLTRMPPFEPGMIIDVELACGRSFRGRIAWSRGEDAGMTFDQPLSPTDPLIFG